MKAIDGHAHLPLDTSDGIAWVESQDIAVVNICVDAAELGGLGAQRGWYRGLMEKRPGRFAWVTSFPLQGFGQPGWADRAIASLSADFAAGAVGCKIWKNVGMELRDPDGRFVFVDDERFAPVLSFLQASGRPLLTHIAEPMAAWSPLDPESPHFDYYSTAKHWHWHGRTDVPTHERLIASRDAIVERYPNLRMIALHLGSQEHDLDAVESRLTRWQNYTVDTGARLGDLALHARRDRDRLRAFFHRWADRIIWGIDWVWTAPLSSRTPAEWEQLRRELDARLALELAFFGTDNEVVICGKPVCGLALPPRVLQALTLDNARRAYFPTLP
jgi:predicted TIM-barrel fold metal-dependent hydrolase